MIIAINGNRHQEGHFEDIDRLVNHLLKADVEVVMSERFIDYLVEHLGERFALGLRAQSLTQPLAEADLAISIGGDGAFLKTARWVARSKTPVAGINTGHLGFLSAYNFDRAEEIYDGLLQGRFEISERSVLLAEVSDGRAFHALNEVAITRADSAPMLQIAATINSRASLNYKGDGLIIATPTGSTAYNLSVGGPIMAPDLAGWVLSPIAAHSLSIRPLVVNDSAVIDIAVTSRGRSYNLLIDGLTVTLPVTAGVRFSRAPFTVNIVQQPHHTFTDTLRDKLGMGN